ncbi:MAG: hypothetical protein CGU28_07925 [Candidatus Dactylopiibacterium carminicum]|nr:MAG: hypothetical protein CGU28_07925 [Candidatus Dactylopiibacterium carminicum]
MIVLPDGRLQVQGAVNQFTVPALQPAGEALVCEADRVVNFSNVTTVDSSALALILAWKRAARAAGHTLSVEAAPVALRNLASLYGVSAIIFPEQQGSDARAQS